MLMLMHLLCMDTTDMLPMLMLDMDMLPMDTVTLPPSRPDLPRDSEARGPLMLNPRLMLTTLPMDMDTPVLMDMDIPVLMPTDMDTPELMVMDTPDGKP